MLWENEDLTQMAMLKISLAQMDVKLARPQENLAALARFAQQAAEQDADVLVRFAFP